MLESWRHIPRWQGFHTVVHVVHTSSTSQEVHSAVHVTHTSRNQRRTTNHEAPSAHTCWRHKFSAKWHHKFPAKWHHKFSTKWHHANELTSPWRSQCQCLEQSLQCSDVVSRTMTSQHSQNDYATVAGTTFNVHLAVMRHSTTINAINNAILLATIQKSQFCTTWGVNFDWGNWTNS